MTKKLNELNLIEALEGLKKREFTSKELTQACLSQINTLDGKLKAFLLVTADQALQAAEEADSIISAKGDDEFVEKPLLGIPYACKDNFNTKDIETTVGSNILKGYIPPYESTVTGKLKEAGAILLGKTNMDAFAHGSSTETSDFFTSRNPWNVDKVPGGSSGGSAVAVAAHMAIFAIGSETGGSIRGPASWCGVTGFKPTYGRVSRYGLIAMASSTDSPGPIAKTAMDCTLVLQSISGKDPLDATSSPQEVPNYSAEISTVSLKGVKIGKPKSYFEIDLEPEVKALNEAALEKLAELGAEIIEVDLMDPKYSIAVYTILQRSEVSSNLARLDGIRYGQDRNSFGFEAKKRMMLGAYALSAGYYDAYYAKAQKVRTLIINDFDRVFAGVDLLAGPSMPCTALGVGESANSPMFGELMDILSEPSTIAGLTGITVPVGLGKGLPVGMQFIGPRFTESRVLGAAKAFQQSTNFHLEQPQILESEVNL